MITIIHGDDSVSSRNFFLSEKVKVKNPLVLDGENFTLSDLKQTLEGTYLFYEEKTIFIDRFFTAKRKKTAEFESILFFLKNVKTEINIFFWENEEVGKTVTNLFKNAQIKLFKIPQNLFQFLDGIRPNNSQNVNLFQTALKNSEPELLLFMITRQFRLLLAVSSTGEKQIDEVKRLAPWQKSKLLNQAKLFSPEQLRNIYKKLYEIDLGSKSGTLNTNLTNTIDFLLLDI